MFNYILSCTFARLHRQISIFARPDSKNNRNSKSKAYFALSFQMGKVSSLPVLFLYFHFGMVSVFFVCFFLSLKKKESFKEKLCKHRKAPYENKLTVETTLPSAYPKWVYDGRLWLKSDSLIRSRMVWPWQSSVALSWEVRCVWCVMPL